MLSVREGGEDAWRKGGVKAWKKGGEEAWMTGGWDERKIQPLRQGRPAWLIFHFSSLPLVLSSSPTLLLRVYQPPAGCQPLSRRALESTNTLESPMAAAASIGLRRTPRKGYNTPAATGMRAVL